jgi:uncharacterized membrane protein
MKTIQANMYILYILLYLKMSSKQSLQSIGTLCMNVSKTDMKINT